MDRMEILSVIGERHTLQSLDVLDNLGANWTEIEDFYVDLVESGEKGILTGNPFTAEDAADQLCADLHRMAELHWLRSITREQAEIMEATVSHEYSKREEAEAWTRIETEKTVLPEGYHNIDGWLYRVKEG